MAKEVKRNQLLMLAGAAILAISLWVVWETYKQQQTADETLSSDEMAGWKTWDNTDHGFQVKYPPDWYLTSRKLGPENTSQLGYIENFQEGVVYRGPGQIGIDFLLNVANKSAADRRDDIIQGFTNRPAQNPEEVAGETGAEYQESEATISGVQAIVITGQDTTPYEGLPYKAIVYLFEYQGDTYQISASTPIEGSEGLFETTALIVSTFRFTK